MRLLKTSAWALGFLGCAFLTVASTFAATGGDRVAAVIELQDTDVASLMATGYFKMEIPRAYKDRIASVVLKRPVRFKDDLAILFNDVDRRGSAIAIDVDDAVMEQIDYQPVELKLYESNLTHIVVHYQPGNGSFISSKALAEGPMFLATLEDGKAIQGTLVDREEFTLASGMGAVDVNLSDVFEIRFEDDNRISVTMLNGDSLSGKNPISSITVNSRWGDELLMASRLASISRIEQPQSGSAVAIDRNTSGWVPDTTLPSTQPLTLPEPLMHSSPVQNSVQNSVWEPQTLAPSPAPMGIPAWSPLQSFSIAPNANYNANGQRIDSVPKSLDAEGNVVERAKPIDTNEGLPGTAGAAMSGAEAMQTAPYDAGQFEQVFEQMTQPVDAFIPSNQPSQQPIGSFFGDPFAPMPAMPMDATLPQGNFPIDEFGTPQPVAPMNSGGNDFWFFPQ